jgi:hypothetical protein
MERGDSVGPEELDSFATMLPGNARIHQKTDALAGTKTLQRPYPAFAALGGILCGDGPGSAQAGCGQAQGYT